MMNEPKSMRQIHVIREQLSSEAIGLSPTERCENARAEAQELINRFGIKSKIISLNKPKQFEMPA
ncbi:MAG: hypothetical protein LBR73_02680 [Oscillospiraceae bacterium]|jgi:hypothetical protein|nr:hypothetical protein [Oscillospiraceae bacterium]